MDWSLEWSNAVFSLEERDLRWGKVRKLMGQAGVDAIVGLPCTNSHDRGAADARYLTQLGENSDETTFVFPLDGPVAAWHSRGGMWPSANWLSTVGAARRGRGGRTCAQYLKELALEDATIAITGLTSDLLSHVRAEEGEANWQSVEIIKTALPKAKLVSATPVLSAARYQKSEEEIEFLRRGTAVAEATVEAARSALRPGIPERHVFADMLHANAIAGGSFQPMIGWISGPLGNTYHRVEQPTFRSVTEGDVLSIEVEGRWGGYISQIDQMYYIGNAPQDLHDGFKLALEVFDDVFEALKPGVTVRELYQLGERSAMGGRAQARLTMHGRGTGDDGPLVTTNITEELLQLEIKENCSLIIKPSVWVDGRADFGHWGETVVVRAKGAERLGTRIAQLYECG